MASRFRTLLLAGALLGATCLLQTANAQFGDNVQRIEINPTGHVRHDDADGVWTDDPALVVKKTDKATVRGLSRTFFGPEPDPEAIIRKWGSEENYKYADPIVTLTDATFEKETQAASGGTTGDWFIVFEAKYCEHCRHMERDWNQTGIDLKGEVIVARIDALQNPMTSHRFDITGYPTLLFIKNGKSYEYKGPRSWREMCLFVRGGYLESSEPQDIPPEYTKFDIIMDRIRIWTIQVISAVKVAPFVTFSAVLLGVFAGIFPIFYILSAKETPPTVRRAQVAKSEGDVIVPEAAASHEKQTASKEQTDTLPEYDPQNVDALVEEMTEELEAERVISGVTAPTSRKGKKSRR